jgi:hypothetical protein
VAGHRDVATGRFLIESGVQLAPVEEPEFEGVGGFAACGARFQLIEQRGDLRPVAEVNDLGDKFSWFRGWQFSKRQQIHGQRIAEVVAGVEVTDLKLKNLNGGSAKHRLP